MATAFSSLCVFCGASIGTNPAHEKAARELGRYLAENQIQLVTGGGATGLMGAVADGCIDAGGELVGVITSYLQKHEVAHPRAKQMDVVETMLERKTRMAALSDAFITLPGGVGTLDELFEMLTWSRVSEHEKPIGLLNVDGFYDEIIAFCRTTQVEAGFISDADAANLIHDTRIESLIEKLAEAAETGPSSFLRS